MLLGFGEFRLPVWIFWSALQHDLLIGTFIIMVACTLLNFIIDTPGDTDLGSIHVTEENNVAGSSIIHIQKLPQIQ